MEYKGEHSDFKADRRQAKRDKAKDKMDQGKRAKMLHQILMDRARKAQQSHEEAQAGEPHD